MVSQKITEISVTPISTYYPHEIGRNARNTGHGISGIEWLVRAKTEGGIEGLTIANAFLSNLGGNSVEELGGERVSVDYYRFRTSPGPDLLVFVSI